MTSTSTIHTDPDKNKFSKSSALPAPLIAFAAACLLFALLLAINGFLFPGSITNGDNLDQYLAFIMSFIRVLKGEQSFWYSFSLYAGSPSVLTYVYYSLSPFNLLYLLPGISLITITHIISILKSGLAAATFSWYSEKTLGQKKIPAVFFSICYAFCSWSVIMSINCMWADSLYLLPVLIVFISRQVKKADIKNFLCLTLSYAFLFITNFYMGYIMGIFTAIYFVCITICTEIDTQNKVYTVIPSILKKIGIFASSVILSAALCAALLLPAGYFLFSHLNGVGEAFPSLSASLPDVFSALFAGSGSGIYSQTPYLYCGLSVMLLVPFYFFSKKISFSKKFCATLILLFYLCASLFLPLYEFLHAYDNPNYYPFRFSPCIVFMLITLAEKSWVHKADIEKKGLWKAAASFCAIYAFLVLFNSVTGITSVSDPYLILNAFFLFTWAFLIIKFSGSNDQAVAGKIFQKKYLYALTFILLAAELLISSSISLRSVAGSSSEDERRMSNTEFNHWYNTEKEAIYSIKNADQDFYRIRVNNEKCFNGAALFGINTLTSFMSYEETAQRTAFANLGIGNAYHMLYDVSGLPLTDMLFSVKYTIDIPSELTTTHPAISENSMVLPIAYTVSSDIASYQSSDNPFESMNNLVHSMTGRDITVYETVSDNGMVADTFNTDVYDLGDMIAYDITTDIANKGWVTYAIPKKENKKAYIFFKPQNGTYFNSLSPYIIRSYPVGLDCSLTMASGAIYEVNRSQESAELTNTKLESSPDDYTYQVFYINTGGYNSYSVNDVIFSYYDENALKEVYDYLKEGTMTVTSFTDDHIEGFVTATENRPVLFTSIPYDKGWTAYVDGVPNKIYVTTDDAFCALALAPGEHTIIFDYTAPYAFAGSVISTIAALILAMIYLKGKNAEKKVPLENNNDTTHDTGAEQTNEGATKA